MDPTPSTSAPSSPGGAVVDRLRADLTVAMRARDKVRVSALRTALAAIANAEAPPMGASPSASEPVVGALVEHRRLDLTPADVERILRHEIADRQDTAEQYEAHGRGDEATVVHAEIAVLAAYVT